MPSAVKAPERAKLRDSHPDSWIAVSPGDELTGKVLDIQVAWSDVRNGHYPLLTIDVEEATGYDAPPEGPDQLKLHAMGSVLFNEVERQRPEVGERLTVKYVGTSDREPKPGQNPAEIYRVTVHGRTDQGARAYGRLFGNDPQPVSGVRSNGGDPDPGTFPPDNL